MFTAQTFSCNKEPLVLQKKLPFISIMSHAMFSKAALKTVQSAPGQGREGAIVSGCVCPFQGTLCHVGNGHKDEVVLSSHHQRKHFTNYSLRESWCLCYKKYIVFHNTKWPFCKLTEFLLFVFVVVFVLFSVLFFFFCFGYFFFIFIGFYPVALTVMYQVLLCYVSAANC